MSIINASVNGIPVADGASVRPLCGDVEGTLRIPPGKGAVAHKSAQRPRLVKNTALPRMLEIERAIEQRPLDPVAAPHKPGSLQRPSKVARSDAELLPDLVSGRIGILGHQSGPDPLKWTVDGAAGPIHDSGAVKDEAGGRCCSGALCRCKEEALLCCAERQYQENGGRLNGAAQSFPQPRKGPACPHSAPTAGVFTPLTPLPLPLTICTLSESQLPFEAEITSYCITT